MLLLPFSPTTPWAPAILPRMADYRIADAVLDGYPEYATKPVDLDAQQRIALFRLAHAVVDSHSTRRPVEAIVIMGHADKALRKPHGERTAFELKISKDRAGSARDLLLAEIRRLAFGAHYSKVMLCVAQGVGSARPVIASAVNEAQMRKNRRVEIFLFQRQLGAPQCRV